MSRLDPVRSRASAAAAAAAGCQLGCCMHSPSSFLINWISWSRPAASVLKFSQTIVIARNELSVRWWEMLPGTSFTYFECLIPVQIQYVTVTSLSCRVSNCPVFPDSSPRTDTHSRISLLVTCRNFCLKSNTIPHPVPITEQYSGGTRLESQPSTEAQRMTLRNIWEGFRPKESALNNLLKRCATRLVSRPIHTPTFTAIKQTSKCNPRNSKPNKILN